VVVVEVEEKPPKQLGTNTEQTSAQRNPKIALSRLSHCLPLLAAVGVLAANQRPLKMGLCSLCSVIIAHVRYAM